MNSVSAQLSSHLLKGPLKGNFVGTYVTMYVGVRKLKNTSAVRVFSFLKMFKLESKFRKCKKKNQKKFFVSEIIASENVAINCLC